MTGHRLEPRSVVIHARQTIAESDVARHYDELDGFYRELWGEHLHHGLWEHGEESVDDAVRALVRRVAANAAVRAQSRVCDVGSGYGATARMLAADFGAHVTAFTLSPVQHALAIAAAGQNERVRYRLGDWLNAAVEAEAFDAVIAIESTEHMADKPRFFAQAAHALRPRGRLVVCAWLEAERTSEGARRWLLEPICSEGRLPSLGRASDYTMWLRDAGFTLLSCDDLTSRVRPTWTLSTRRLLRRLFTRPSSWAYLLDRRNGNRVFALTVLRILAAYRFGAMRYAMFTAVRGEA